ncbi:hypothetical protein [Paraburkholderia caribensis]|uniref:hypothetical protein n=1 Tax=Paraburkholderia caribensis TaxID=75105 RepID=UPI001CC7682C|nr:hypothetical protein [Paraburkholderia caribensis]
MYQALSVTVAPDNAGLDFGLVIRGEVQHFRISLEALRDQFGADEADDDDALLDCFLDGEQVICAKAFALSTIPPSKSRVRITSRDFCGAHAISSFSVCASGVPTWNFGFNPVRRVLIFTESRRRSSRARR